MKKARKYRDQIKSVIVILGTLFCYIVVSVVMFLFYRNATPYVPPEEQLDLPKVILESLSNTITIVGGVVDGIIAVVFWCYNKNTSRLKIIIFTALFFGLIAFNTVASRYPLTISWVALVDSTIFVVGMVLLLVLRDRNQQPVQEGTKKFRIGNIRNKKIIAEQIFSVKRELTATDVVYTCSSFDYSYKPGHDINGILSVSYKIPRGIDNTFEAIRNMYLALITEGSKETKERLVSLLESEANQLINYLKTIPSSSEITLLDCCKARILLIYKAFLTMLDPQPEHQSIGWYGGEAYIGEICLGDGELGISEEIEHRLFTLLRTGILGSILLGPDLRYIFRYHKDGYKTGRCYSAICFPSTSGSSSGVTNCRLCLFTLDDIQSGTIPQYITEAIRKEENRIAEGLHKMERGDINGESA